MRSTVLFGGMLFTASAIAFACSSSSDDSAVTTPADGGEDTSLTLPSGGDDEGPAGTGSKTGLPCDVQAVVENRCITCHDGKTAVAMLSYNDFAKPSAADPAQTIAQLSVARMKSTTSPMPPKPAEAPDADEIQIFEDWVNAGTPRETKACTDPPPDGGATDGGVRADGGDAGVVCSSGTRWMDGNEGSPLMHPGLACNACHAQMGGPNLRVAGTVYPTLHEPNDCNGKGPPPPLTVVIIENGGRRINIPVNAAGNFSLRQRPRAPFRAEIREGNKVRAMTGSVTSGDCNSCHTQNGANGAPGRILTP